jgi:hypothetical protein
VWAQTNPGFLGVLTVVPAWVVLIIVCSLDRRRLVDFVGGLFFHGERSESPSTVCALCEEPCL